MSIKVCLPGLLGRMGQEVERAILQNNEFTLNSAIVRKEQIKTNKVTADCLITDNINDAINESDICIDFSKPELSLRVLESCIKLNKPIVIGTTGFTKEQEKLLINSGQSIPILKSSNMSIGINLCVEIVELLSKKIGNKSDINIFEHHHKHKFDKPSGTSLMLEDVIKENIEKNNIEHFCLRGGNVVGEHTVSFSLENEVIEIKHKANQRLIFALGALNAAQWLLNKDNGFYSMKDVLS